ncbi:hypothetical protein TUM20984_00630 [Mycobacterium antarcticum]|nr:hypothetical protein TUM20984_00630 [Mycolicibacterium sp. TUM20984]
MTFVFGWVPEARMRPASMTLMSDIIEALLLRNLQEVFGENDPERLSLARVMGPPDCQGDGTTVARY